MARIPELVPPAAVTTEVPGLFFAGPHTAAGNGLSPTVLAGALASYAAHESQRSEESGWRQPVHSDVRFPG